MPSLLVASISERMKSNDSEKVEDPNGYGRNISPTLRSKGGKSQARQQELATIGSKELKLRLWFEEDNDEQEQSSIPTKLSETKQLNVTKFDERLLLHRNVSIVQERSTVASNLFSMDPNIGIAVNLGRKGGMAVDCGAQRRGRPSLLRAASDGDFPESLPPIRRCSLQPAQLPDEVPSKPLKIIDVECSKEQPLLKPYQRANTATNEPHPCLEYPPLYFIIKKWPWLLEAVKSLYLYRWKMSYPLQRRVPASQFFRKIGVHFTWGELILLLPFFALVAVGTLWSLLYPSPRTTGQVSRLPLIFCFATALHNSFLSLLLGMPFERALWYHKQAGRIAFLNGILHTYVCYFYPDDDLTMNDRPSGRYAHVKFEQYFVYDRENISGTAILGLITAMVVTSVPFFRNKFFEFFYYLHIFFAACMAGCAFYHSGKIVPILAAATWGVDLIIRKVIMAVARYPRQAQTRIISTTVVELRFSKTKGFDFNPGQYVYLCVPAISLLEWHPFSISSSPGQKTVTLHIRKVGNWTSALHELAQTKDEIQILMEGPFGSVGVDITSQRYSYVMLISGGIGITPMQSICNQLIHEHCSGKRSMKKLSFLWMERDPIVMSDVDVVRRSSSAHFDTIVDDLSVISDLEEGLKPHCREESPMSIASTFLAHVPPSMVKDSDLDNQYDIQLDSKDINTQVPRRNSLLAVIADMPPTVARHLSMSHNPNHAGHSGKRNSSRSLGRHSEHNRKPSLSRTSDQARTAMGREASMTSLGYLSDRPVFDDEPHNDINDFGDDDTFLDAAYPQTTDALPMDVLDMQVYLTSKDPNSCFGNLPFVHEGRPNIIAKFLQIRQEAIAAGESRVAVCVCAPQAIVSICQKASIKFSNHQVQFDFHSEMFG